MSEFKERSFFLRAHARTCVKEHTKRESKYTHACVYAHTRKYLEERRERQKEKRRFFEYTCNAATDRRCCHTVRVQRARYRRSAILLCAYAWAERMCWACLAAFVESSVQARHAQTLPLLTSHTRVRRQPRRIVWFQKMRIVDPPHNLASALARFLCILLRYQ